jgi:hypothetical protein
MTTAVSSNPLPPRMTRAEGEELVARWRASGLGQRDFCRQQGFPEARLHRWLTKLRRVAGGPQPQTASGFSAVVAGNGVRLRLPSGAAIELDAHFDPQVLRRVVEALC